MPFTETEIDLRRFPDEAREAIQRQADEWGMSFDDACLRMLVEHSRAVRALRDNAQPGLLSRLFGNRAAH